MTFVKWLARRRPGEPPYGRARFFGDFSGGIIAAMIALPYGLAMATLMGLPPVMGIFTSILSAPFIAFLGRNPVLIGGTASATVPFVAFAVVKHGPAGAAMVTIMASLIMVVMAVARLGRQIMKVPHVVVAGFSCGVGGLMVASQMHVLLGVKRPEAETAAGQLIASLMQIGDAHAMPFLLAAVVILAAAVCARFSTHMPAPLIGVLFAIGLANVLGAHEKVVGAVRLEMPQFQAISWNPGDLLALVPSALGLAFVASINILITSRVVEHFRGKHKHMKPGDADAELRAYGVANCFAGLFGAPPSVGIPARSLAVVKCGGTTPVANLIHALVLGLMLVVGAPLVSRIPLAALAGVTVWMAVGLLNWSFWRRLPRMRRADAATFLLTAVAVMVTDSVTAVIVGTVFYGVCRWAIWMRAGKERTRRAMTMQAREAEEAVAAGRELV